MNILRCIRRAAPRVHRGGCTVTVDLVRRANRAMIEGKVYAPHIEAAAARLPRLSAEEINQAWAKINERPGSENQV